MANNTTNRSYQEILPEIAVELNKMFKGKGLPGEWIFDNDINRGLSVVVADNSIVGGHKFNTASEWKRPEYEAFQKALAAVISKFGPPFVVNQGEPLPFIIDSSKKVQPGNARPFLSSFTPGQENKVESFVLWLRNRQKELRDAYDAALQSAPSGNANTNTSPPSTIILTPGNQQQQHQQTPPQGSPYQFTPEELAGIATFRNRFVSDPQNPNPNNPLVETWVDPTDINYGIEYWDKQTNSYAFRVEPAAAPNGGIHLAPQINDRDLALAVMHAVKMYGNFDVNNGDKAFHDKVVKIVHDLHTAGLLLDANGQQVAQKPAVRHITGPAAVGGAGPARPGAQAGPQPQPATAGATP